MLTEVTLITSTETYKPILGVDGRPRGVLACFSRLNSSILIEGELGRFTGSLANRLIRGVGAPGIAMRTKRTIKKLDELLNTTGCL